MTKILICLLFIFPILIHSEEEQIHISQETPDMIQFRCIMIDESLMRIGNMVMYYEMTGEVRDLIFKEIDDIWFQLGI